MILLFQEKVEVLEFHDLAVRSTNKSHPLPSVMRLKKYIRLRGNPKITFSRENVFIRDDYTCQYCAKVFTRKELTLDHVLPVSQGGLKTWDNVVAACKVCNHRKGNRTPATAKMPLLNEPRAPMWPGLENYLRWFDKREFST